VDLVDGADILGLIAPLDAEFLDCEIEYSVHDEAASRGNATKSNTLAACLNLAVLALIPSAAEPRNLRAAQRAELAGWPSGSFWE